MRAIVRASRLILSALAGATASVALHGDARAVEREHHLGIDGNFAMLDIADKSSLSTGLGMGAHYTYGITDMFDLMIEGNYSVVALHQMQDNPDSPHTRPAGVGTFSAGIGYVIDILRWVPYVGLMGTAGMMVGGTLDSTQWLGGGTLAAGLDYKLTRSFTVGLAYRQTEFLTQMSTYPSYSTFLLRTEYVWGF